VRYGDDDDANIVYEEQYALTEASYTMVKLMQRFSKLENGDPGVEVPIIQSNLTLAHGDGVKVRLF
jgi:hypothetical protein